MPNWRHCQENLWPLLNCKWVCLCHCCTCTCKRQLWFTNYKMQLVKNKTEFCELVRSGGGCTMKKSTSHSFCSATKFGSGFIPVDTSTVRLTCTTGLQKIPRYPSECHYIMLHFMCNVLSGPREPLRPFLSDTIDSHWYVTHSDTTF